MKSEILLFCLVETNYQSGLGHWYRVANFINQTLESVSIKSIYIISFGDYQPLFSELNKKENTYFSHFTNFEIAYEYLFSTTLKTSPQKEVQPFLIIDINHQFNKNNKLAINQLKTWFYTIGLYNKTNNISDLSFSAHINPNYFKDQNSFKKSSSNTLYLLGPEFRIFSTEIIDLWKLEKTNDDKSDKINILIIAGNTDPQNRIPSIIQTLKSISDNRIFSFHIILPNKQESSKINDGKFYHFTLPSLPDNLETINNRSFYLNSHDQPVSKSATEVFNFYGNVLPHDLIKLYPKMTAAITASGGTFWELNSLNIRCLLIPGSSDESISARWLVKMTDHKLLLESHEQFSSEHSAQLLNFLSNIKNSVSESDLNPSREKSQFNTITIQRDSSDNSRSMNYGIPLIWQSIQKHLKKYYLD